MISESIVSTLLHHLITMISQVWSRGPTTNSKNITQEIPTKWQVPPVSRDRETSCTLCYTETAQTLEQNTFSQCMGFHAESSQNWEAYQTINPIFRPFCLNWKDHTVAPLVSQLLTNRQLRRFLSVLIQSLTLHKLCWNAQSSESPASNLCQESLLPSERRKIKWWSA